MVYNPFDYIKHVNDVEAKEIVRELRKKGEKLVIRTDYVEHFDDDCGTFCEYHVEVNVMEYDKFLGTSLPKFRYLCHYGSKADADAFCGELKEIR